MLEFIWYEVYYVYNELWAQYGCRRSIVRSYYIFLKNPEEEYWIIFSIFSLITSSYAFIFPCLLCYAIICSLCFLYTIYTHVHTVVVIVKICYCATNCHRIFINFLYTSFLVCCVITDWYAQHTSWVLSPTTIIVSL